MRTRSAFLDGFFAAGNTLQDSHPVLKMLKSLNIHKVCGWAAVLGDENGVFLFVENREDSGCLPFERCDQFCLHM